MACTEVASSPLFKWLSECLWYFSHRNTRSGSHLRSAWLLVTRGGQRREKGNEEDTTSRRKSNREKYSERPGVGWGRGTRDSHWNIKLENALFSLKRINAIVIQAFPGSTPSWFHIWAAYLILHFAISSDFVISYHSGRSEGYHRHTAHRCCEWGQLSS